MTKDELKQQYIKWAERCGVADKLGSDLDRKADDALKNVTAHILDTTSEATIEKTTIGSVLLSRFAIEWGEKSLDMNAAIFALCCAEILYQMQSEIDALKDKARWRKQSEEPAPKDIELLVCGRGRKGQAYFLVTETDGDYWYDNIGDSVSLDVDYWRPLDLPEMGETK